MEQGGACLTQAALTKLARELRRQARVGISVVGECEWFETKKSASYARSVLSSCSTRSVCVLALGRQMAEYDSANTKSKSTRARVW